MDGPFRPPHRPQSWLIRLALSPRFHRLAARIPFLRGHVRTEGAALFDVVQGFVRAQVLMALVDLHVLDRLAEGPLTDDELGLQTLVPLTRLRVLLRAATALHLVRPRGPLWHLTPRGAAFTVVPGLAEMVSHHRALYADLADAAGFFRSGEDTQLAAFWPYVFGQGIGTPEAERFSHLMGESQSLVAADTLAQVSLRRRQHLLDVGGGHGAFLKAVAVKHPHLRLTLFDLAEVVAGAEGLPPQITRAAGSFRTDPLPQGADSLSLIRVLYDHSDSTVSALLTRAYQALPKGGLLVISEPMAGEKRPDPATDIYFAVYTMAMQTGRTRQPSEIAALVKQAGFSQIHSPNPARPYVTRVLTARR